MKIALAVGLALSAAAIGFMLGQSPPALLATNGVAGGEDLSILSTGGERVCQSGERLPAGTRGIQLSIRAFTGPSISLTMSSHGRVVASGRRAVAGWSGEGITIPVQPLDHTVSAATVCFSTAALDEKVTVVGSATAPAMAAHDGAGEALAGRFRIGYLGAGHVSWLARASSVARHMELGRAWSGPWIVALVVLLMLGALTVACRLILESPLPTAPLAAWLCAAVACFSAVSWSFITPPFQVPDEPDHFAYVKQLAETGSRPTQSREATYAAEEVATLELLRYGQLRLHPESRAIFTQATQKLLDEQSHVPSERGSTNAGVATAEPPLYYALESIPYTLASSGPVLERLQTMRLLSALLAGLTTLFGFLFLRETLPRTPWCWTLGALCIAFCPLLGFMSGAVNPDAMLYAACAALFFCLARAFRRGLAVRSAIATGCVIAIGVSTKLNFVGLLPGAYFALGIVALRGNRVAGWKGVRHPALAGAIGLLPILVFVAANVLDGKPALGIADGFLQNTGGSAWHELAYIWQLYFPRLPAMPTDFPGISTARQIWFDGYVGRLGWLDTFFPGWVYTLALLIACLLGGLCLRGALVSRQTVRSRVFELASYALMALGLMVLVGAASYHVFPVQVASYGQARYLLPLLPLLATLLALAARGAGRRWGPATGALIVVLFAAHDLVSQLQVVARYYG